jgi:hypothetical protein
VDSDDMEYTEDVTLNFLPYKPTRPVSSNIYRPTINSTGPNLKTTLMTINSFRIFRRLI